MGIFASLFAFLGRFVGRVLSMAMGWATILLFGRVPRSKQLLLSLISLGSIAWVATVLGVIFPSVGALLVSFAPIPESLADRQFAGIAVREWVRIAMLIAALTIPLLVGIAGYFMLAPEDRPRGRGVFKQILRGYPYAAVLALSMLFMVVIAPARKLRSMSKRWEDAHIPVVVKPGGYDMVANDLERALDEAGLDIERTGAPRVLEAPSKLLGKVAGPGVDRLVPDRLIQLRNKRLEVLIYPSDVSLVGEKDQVAHARAAIASRLTFTAAYLTTSEETQQIEDRLERIWHAVPAIKTAAQALGPAISGGGSGREAAAIAVEEVRVGKGKAAEDARASERDGRAAQAEARTAAGEAAAAAGDGADPTSGSGTGTRPTPAPVPTGSGDTGADAASIADTLPPFATRDELLAAGHVAPPDAPVKGDGMDPKRIDQLIDELSDVDARLAELVVPHEEWEVLYRLRLQVERDLLETRDILEGRVDGAPMRPDSVDGRLFRGIATASQAVQRRFVRTPLAKVAGAVRQSLPAEARGEVAVDVMTAARAEHERREEASREREREAATQRD